MLRWITCLLLCLTSLAYAQSDRVWLHPNRGQWDHRIAYKVELHSGEMLVEDKGFTFHFFEQTGDSHHEHASNETPGVHGHVIRSRFLNAQTPSHRSESLQSSFYRNYFLNGAETWRSKIYAFGTVVSENLYPGIHLQLNGGEGTFKYSWIVTPGADQQAIKWEYEGADAVELNEDGTLTIRHSMGSFKEGKPIAWKIRNGKHVPVKVAYVIEGNTVHFATNLNGTDSDTLIIDPSLTFSTFTGSTTDNWGFTATPHPNGSLFAGGISFGNGYPTSVGAFDHTFNGGSSSLGSFGIDVGISKFNQTGSSLLYSTYIGGSGNETPHSIVSNPNGELYILGATSSFNFPMAGTPFDNTFNGGPDILENSLGFDGTDMYIARLSADGTSLIASTYVGGSGTDGINTGILHFNYGDQFRGEIIWINNSIYVASVTASTDFPTVNASQSFLNGAQDAVVFRISPDLSSMQWSTYFGGTGSETGNGLQASSTGDIYVAGGTSSTGLPFGSGYDLSYNGGMTDGYLLRLNGSSGTLLSGTYIGTDTYDQSYFVQLDPDDAVYTYGQTEGTIGISPGCYGNANSGQFIAKYTTNLQNQLWTTVIGSGSGHVEISPTAFLVSNCKDIYVTGWGGNVNVNNSQAIHSSSNGFPTTGDAYQSSTNGSNFWIAVLDEDAAFLKYATFMGGMASSSNHVDGGTSRFDKNGNIYHAVCAACGSNDNGFTTTPGVWSPTNPSPNCNLAAWKFSLSTIEAVVSDPEPLICLPDPVVFLNNSANGNAFLWNFGDNTTSTDINPSHVYANAGNYTVTLVVTDTNNCFAPDSVEFQVSIGDFQGGIVQPASGVCPGASYQFQAYGGANYAWSPAQFLNNPNIPNPVANITQNTLFSCVISDSCGIDTVQVWLNVFGGSVQVSNDTTICFGNSVPLQVQGVSSATWSPPTYLDNANTTNPVSTPQSTVTYTVNGVTNDGCQLNEQVTITVVFDTPTPSIPDTVRYCAGSSVLVNVSGGETYQWSPPVDITPLTGPSVTISSQTERYYYCAFGNACGTETDSVYVDITAPVVVAGNDTIVCPGQPAVMHATGGVSYSWFPAVTSLNQDASLVQAIAPSTMYYTVTGMDDLGCTDQDSVLISLFPQPFIQTVPDIYAVLGDAVQLSAVSATQGPFTWSPSEYLSCVVCTSPMAQPDKNMTYTVTYTDENGCSASDDIRILYDPIIYIPNAFTPDGNKSNAEFFAVASNVRSLKMEIYNRWGERVYLGESQDKSWDGTYKGLPCPDGVYVWKVYYTDLEDKAYSLIGHVSLLR